MPQIPRVPLRQRTPIVTSLLNTARQTRATAKQLRRRYKDKCEELKDIKKNLVEKALDKLREKLSPNFMKILEVQVRNAGRNPHGYRYTPDEKLVFLGMRQRGARQYFNMPFIKTSRKTNSRLLRMLNLKPGVNPIVMEGLAARVAEEEDEEKKDVIVILDELSAKTFYFYDSQNDLIGGFADLGNGDRRDLPAEEAMVAMVRFVYGTGKQPVAWWYTHKKMTAMDYVQMFREVLEAMVKAKCRVRGMLTDGLGKNKLAMIMMGASEEEPWIYIDEIKIYTIFDVPHLLKSLRNAILKYILLLPHGLQVKFQYIKDFIELDMQMRPRIAKKITKTHLDPNNFEKMNVELAGQLFSSTVAVGVLVYAMLGGLPPDAVTTGNFLELINNLFDSCNGIDHIENPEEEQYKCAVSENSHHITLWDKMDEEMANWHFVGSKNLQFPQNWRMTLKAFKHLWYDLKAEGRTHMPVGHINSDCIENNNGQIRLHGGPRRNPSVRDFPAAFAATLINNLTTSVKGKNCRDENSLNIINLQHLYNAAQAAHQRDRGARLAQKEQEAFVTHPEPELIEEDDDDDWDDLLIAEDEEEEEEEDEDPVTANDPVFVSALREKLARVAGAQVAAPIVERHLKMCGGCEACTGELQSEVLFPLHLPHTLTSRVPEINNSKKKLPSEAISKVSTDIYNAVAHHLPAHSYRPGVMANLLEIFNALPSVRSLQLCPEHENTKDALLKSIALGAIQEFITGLNQELRKKKQKKKSQKYQIVTHQ